MKLEKNAIKDLFDKHSKCFSGSSKVMTYERFERAVQDFVDNSQELKFSKSFQRKVNIYLIIMAVIVLCILIGFYILYSIIQNSINVPC